MKIAIVAAGFAPSRADELRRAMATFKKVGTIGQFKDEFINGMLARGYEREFAERCFSQIQGFGTYGFPESHAASFALLVYCSAWMKCYYPDVFAAAILNSQPMGFYAPAQLVRDAREHGVEVRPADVNASDWDHTLELVKAPSSCPFPARGEGTLLQPAQPAPSPLAGEGWGEGELPQKHKHALRLGLRLIAGMRDGRNIMEARKAGGAFKTPEDLMRRAKLKPSAMLTLARADAFGSLDFDRRETLWNVAGLETNELPLFRPGDATEMPMPQKSAVIPELDYPAISAGVRL
jgi:error-prone DNA polymerase